jgi:hypothetical protein
VKATRHKTATSLAGFGFGATSPRQNPDASALGAWLDRRVAPVEGYAPLHRHSKSKENLMLRSLALAVGAVLAFGVAQAAAPSFESLDKNGDGKLSLDEASAHDGLFTEFKNLDENKDGELTKQEFAKYSGN